jgi:DNA repair protein RadC
MGDPDGVTRLKRSVRITTVQAAADFLKPYSSRNREHMVVLHATPLLDVFAEQTCAVGTMTSVSFEMHDIFRAAILMDTKTIIVAHNHPYESHVVRSIKDTTLTKELIEAGMVLKIPVLDHIVLGPERFWSYRRHGDGGFDKSENYTESLGEFGATYIRSGSKISNTFMLDLKKEEPKKKRRRKK